MPITFCDFETYSEVDLRKVGAHRYATDPSTEILCMSYRTDGGKVQRWLPGDPPPDLVGHELHAWNAFFEILIWKYIGTPQHGFPEFELNQWHDTMALAAYFGFPLDLFRASKAVGDDVKDRRGSYLISVLCKPVKPTKARPWERLTPENSPELFEEFYAYCDKDVLAEMSVHNAMPRGYLPEQEQFYWLQNIEASLRGVYVDMKLVSHLRTLRDQCIRRGTKQCKKLTGGLTPTQREKLWLHLCLEHGAFIPDLTAKTLEDALVDPETPESAKEIIAIRQSCSKTSVQKLDAMDRVVSPDGRVHGMQVYHGAHTGRYVGRLVQLHNLPKGDFKVKPIYPEIVREGLELEPFEMLFGDPMEGISTLVRSCIRASEGKVLYVADFNAIEAVVLAWEAGEEGLLALFRQKKSVYKASAVKIFELDSVDQVTEEQRGLGKVQILGCGFGMGKDRFFETCHDWGVPVDRELSDRTVDLYRQDNPNIVRFWYDADDACKAAIRNPHKIFSVGPIKVASNGQFLFAKLPSGRTINYPMPQIRKVKKDWGVVDAITYMGVDSMTKQWRRLNTWGGSLVENWTQGIARDVMCEAQTRIESQLDMDYLFSVHDEVIFESEDQSLYSDFMEIMVEPPAWALDMPIAAEGTMTLRFKK